MKDYLHSQHTLKVLRHPIFIHATKEGIQLQKKVLIAY
jgi:hypothetical protein